MVVEGYALCRLQGRGTQSFGPTKEGAKEEGIKGSQENSV